MRSDLFVYALIFLKFSLGLFAIALGVHQQDTNVMLFGAGHAFIGAPLWWYFR